MRKKILKRIVKAAATLEPEEKEWLAKALQIDQYEKALEEIYQKVWRPYLKQGYSGKLGDIIDRNNRGTPEEMRSGEVQNDVLDAIEILNLIYVDILEQHNVRQG